MAVPDTIFYLLGLGLLGLGLILQIVGLATPEWNVYTLQYYYGSIGLWKACYAGQCGEYITVPDKTNATRAFAIIAVLLGGAAGFLLIVNFMFSLSGKPANKLLALGSVAAGCAAFGSVIISVAIWGSDFHELTYGYSFILCIVGGILMMIGGLIGFVGFQKSGGVH